MSAGKIIQGSTNVHVTGIDLCLQCGQLRPSVGSPPVDFGERSVRLAASILLNLGIATDPSYEPGADPRRDRIAALIERALPT